MIINSTPRYRDEVRYLLRSSAIKLKIYHDRILLNDKLHLKSVFKLTKLLRDTQGMDGLKMFSKQYGNLTPHLDLVESRYIKLDHDDQTRNQRIIENIVNIILELMKKTDPLFASMKPRVKFTGSYYEGLKITEPTEFDTMFVLTLPSSGIKLDSSRSLPGYTNIYLQPAIPRLCDNLGRISAKEVRSWMQSVCDRSLKLIPQSADGNITSIEIKSLDIGYSSSGPAYTLIIKDRCLTAPIHVDLVPSFELEMDVQPSNSMVDLKKAKSIYASYYLVPKPTDNDFNWIFSFNSHDKILLNDKLHLKSVFKLIKLLRDTQGMDGLVSYYIKTVFLWEIEKQGFTSEFWTNSKADLFVYMLKVLRDCLAKKRITSYWCPNLNLLRKESLSDITIQQWENRLTNIINNIEVNYKYSPHVIMNYFVR